MGPTVEISDALFEDLPSILDLQRLCYEENAIRYNNFRILPMIQTLREVEDEFRSGVFLKAIDRSRIIGSIRARQTDQTCFIVRLFVHPDHQNRGIGKRLITSIEARFPNVFRFELFTGYKDEKNISFYKKLGYTRFRDDKREDGMVFYHMEKYRE